MNEGPPIISGVSSSKTFFLWTILFLVGAIIAGVACFKYWLSIPPKEVVQADGGFKKAKATIDPEKLRAWALEEIQKYSATNEPSIPNSEIPSYIQKLFREPPEDAGVVKNGDQRFIEFIWGGPFFHWYIDIGSTNFAPPIDSKVTTVKWVSGIYFGREDK
jgi:hypothetical protein